MIRYRGWDLRPWSCQAHLSTISDKRLGDHALDDSVLAEVGVMSEAFAYIAAGIVFLWGVSHIIPTRQVVAGFGDISRDNRFIITMEWVAEGLSFMFVAMLIVAVTWSGKTPETAEDLVYRVVVGFLLAIGAWTAMTGARTGVIWFKMCPVVMSVTSGLLIAASLV